MGVHDWYEFCCRSPGNSHVHTSHSEMMMHPTNTEGRSWLVKCLAPFMRHICTAAATGCPGTQTL